MIIEEALLKRRTIRLYQQKPVPKEDLRFMIDAARQTSCASNLQRLRFVVVTTPSTVQEMLAKTAWAALVKPRRTPVSGVTGPAAFIAVTVPENANSIVAASATPIRVLCNLNILVSPLSGWLVCNCCAAFPGRSHSYIHTERDPSLSARFSIMPVRTLP